MRSGADLAARLMLETLGSLAHGALQVLSWPAVGFLLVGVVIGSIVGLLPGIGGPAMLAMLLPFTISLSPLSAFALLLGASSVVATAGDLTAILLGVPGESISAAIVADGHAMARRGEAGRALGAALASALMGTLFGAAVLTAAVPVAGPMLRWLGSPELFMLALLGMTFIAPLAAPSPLKGLIAGALGLFLATVGLDPISARPRYTFGSLYLWDGVGVLPVALGLYAIPEAIALATAGRSRAPATAPGKTTVRMGVRDAIARWPLVLRCSAIGGAIGILPGMGASVAQWVAYAHATSRRRSASPAETGAVEGVIGPAAATNATLGGALIPTLLLGIPGSLMTAILLNGFLIKGVVPGESLLKPEAQGGHLALLFSIVLILVLANLIAVAVFGRLAAPLGRLAEMRGSLLLPGVLVLTIAGAYLEKNAIEDLLVVAVMGVLGWTMAECRWPRAPLLLGLVLGPMLENRLFLSINLYGGSWLWRPGVLLICAVILAAAAASFRRVRRRDGPHSAASSPLDLVLVASVAALSLAAIWAGQSLDSRGGLFPRAALAILSGLALVQLFISIRRWRTLEHHLPPALSTALAWVASFFVVAWAVGFEMGLPIMTFVYLLTGARERSWTALAQALLVAGFLEGILKLTLHAPLPDGWLTGLWHAGG